MKKVGKGEGVEGIAKPTSFPAVDLSSSSTLFGTTCTALNFRAVNLLCNIGAGNNYYVGFLLATTQPCMSESVTDWTY